MDSQQLIFALIGIALNVAAWVFFSGRWVGKQNIIFTRLENLEKGLEVRLTKADLEPLKQFVEERKKNIENLEQSIQRIVRDEIDYRHALRAEIMGILSRVETNSTEARHKLRDEINRNMGANYSEISRRLDTFDTRIRSLEISRRGGKEE